MRKNNGLGTTRIIHHKMDDIEVFPIRIDQLDLLEKGSNSDLFLEIGLCLVSIFGSFLCSLLVVDFTTNHKAFEFFLIVCIISGIISAVMLILWYRNRNSKSEIIQKIKSQKVEEYQ